MESPESQLSNLLFFVEFWLNLVIFVEFSNRDLRFPKFHESRKNADFTNKNASKIQDFAIFMEFWKSRVSIQNQCLGDLPEVEIQRKIANWKAEIQGFPSVEESASEDITIKSYDDFEIPQNSLKFIENS